MPNSDELASALDTLIERNAPLLRKLKEVVHSNQGIVPFVGAGMSVRFQMPDWHTFLLEAARPQGLEMEVEERLKPDPATHEVNYEAAADLLEERLGAGLLAQAVLTKFDLKAGVSGRGKPAALLPKLAGNLIVTTNYDRVIELVFKEGGRPIPEGNILTGERSDAVIQRVGRSELCLWKIHGDIDEIESRVLTTSEYNRAYPQRSRDGRIHVSDSLKYIAQKVTFLFLGTSLESDRTLTALREAHDPKRRLPHYAFLREPHDKDGHLILAKRVSHERKLADLGINVIWYPAADHEHAGLERLLRHLVLDAPFVDFGAAAWTYWVTAGGTLAVAVGAMFIERLNPGVSGLVDAGWSAIILGAMVLGLAASLTSAALNYRAGRLPVPVIGTFGPMERRRITAAVIGKSLVVFLVISVVTIWGYWHFFQRLDASTIVFRPQALSGHDLSGPQLYSFAENWGSGDLWRWGNASGKSAYPGLQMWIYWIGKWLFTLVATTLALLAGAATLRRGGARR